MLLDITQVSAYRPLLHVDCRATVKPNHDHTIFLFGNIMTAEISSKRDMVMVNYSKYYFIANVEFSVF
jgi:hypothetical protein